MLTGLISFDTRTLLGVLVWGNAAAGIIICLYHTLNIRNSDRKSIRNMTIIRFLCAVGYLLLFLRGTINDIISVNIGNTILLSSHYMEARLMLVLSDSSSKKLNNVLTSVSAVSILTFNILELYYKNVSLRICMASVIIFLIFIIPTIRIVTSNKASIFKKSICIFYIFLLFALIPRTVLSLVDINITVMTDHYVQTLMFMAFILMTLSNTVIYLLFIKEQTDIAFENNNAITTLLNALDIFILVTEKDTDKVLFSNDKMNSQFRFGEDSEGKICYDLMHPGTGERCSFCVKSDLIKNPELAETMDSVVEIGGCNYTKADRIIDWHDGRKVHLQYFTDITELTTAEAKLESQLSQLERMSALINAAQQSISCIKPNGKFEFFNPATCELSGYSAEELMEADAFSFYDAPALKRISDEILPMLVAHGKYDFELPMTRKDGEVRIMKYSAFVIGGDGGGHGYIISDVTDVKQLEQSVVEAKNKAEHILNTSPIAYGLSIDGIVIEVNEYAKKHLGLKPGDETASLYANTEDRDILYAQAEAGKSLVNKVILFKMPGGESHRFLTSFSLLKMGQKEAIVLWAVDIESSERQRDQLQSSQESLQTLLNVMPITVRILDMEDETLIYANQAAFKMYGVESTDAVYGKRVDALMPETQPNGENSVEMLHALNMSIEPISREMVFRKSNGEDFDARISVFTISYKGRAASVGIIQDLSAEKAYANMLRNTAEREKEANRSKSEFLSRMSHEIRTPMNAIIGMTSIAQKSGELGKIRTCLDKIENASKHLLGVINDILDMTKIEADKLELFHEEFNFGNMLNNIIDIINFDLERKRQTLQVSIDEGVPQYIVGDEQRLSQVVTNLLSNATKFTPEHGAIEMHVAKIDERENECILQVMVKDSGIGISAEQQSTIFNSFEQAGRSIARKYGGTGLGLTISKRIVELMGGQIWVESEPGRGSKFIFTIKADKGSGWLTTSELTDDPASDCDFSGRTILMAEDIDINRDIIAALLEETGIVIDEAINGLDAVTRFRNNPERYCLVLMDINMPEMDGYGAAAGIRSLEHKNAKEVPIIAMTADVFKEDIERCLASGMNDHIGKPVDVDELFIKLKKYLIR